MTPRLLARCAVLVCVAAIPTARPALAQGRTVGVKGGVDVSTLHVTPANDSARWQWSGGVVAGAFVTQPILWRLDVQVEALYAQKGARLTIAGLKQTLHIDYVEVPILVRSRFGRYHAEAGPTAAWRVRAVARTPFAGSTESVDIGREVARNDYGIAAGGGMAFGRLDLDARYTHGLKNIDADNAGSNRTKNRVVAVTAGVKF